jgi:hypothetical protein
MVFGIFSLVFACFFPVGLAAALIGLILSIGGVRASKGHGTAWAGVVCSCVALAISAVLIVGLIAYYRHPTDDPFRR